MGFFRFNTKEMHLVYKVVGVSLMFGMCFVAFLEDYEVIVGLVKDMLHFVAWHSIELEKRILVLDVMCALDMCYL